MEVRYDEVPYSLYLIIQDAVRSLKLALERLRSLLEDYVVEHESLEKEILRKVLHLQNTLDQQVSRRIIGWFFYNIQMQMDYWMLLLNDGVAEMRTLISAEQGTSQQGHPQISNG